jgi:hypothetical protein
MALLSGLFFLRVLASQAAILYVLYVLATYFFLYSRLISRRRR